MCFLLLSLFVLCIFGYVHGACKCVQICWWKQEQGTSGNNQQPPRSSLFTLILPLFHALLHSSFHISLNPSIIYTLIPPTHSPLFSFVVSLCDSVPLCLSCNSFTHLPSTFTYRFTLPHSRTTRGTQAGRHKTLTVTTATNDTKEQRNEKCPQIPSISQRSSQE